MSRWDDEMFREFEMFESKFLKRFEDLMEAVRQGKLKGDWEITPIDKPDAKGYVARGFFKSGMDQSLDTPTQPKIPKGPREPFFDVIEDEDHVKVYVELPGVKKEEIQLDAIHGELEVKAGPFLKKITLPGAADIEKPTTRYNNGVLEVEFPKQKNNEPRKRIKLE
ncbi:MAG: Hsp20 family protein [Nitrososphaeria archaeon]|nr:Hsp20 family protein [Nitrososphaeria archaeon]NIN52957.1 Hsp20 family protein [Nitrososphaeria archaeon]NIQ33516.1 Hsp20 family protein [Nitrososphaeria archaeon]